MCKAIKGLGNWSRNEVPCLGAGRRLWLDGPYGAFTYERAAAQGFGLIAGGIGIAPMRSMLLTMRDRHDKRPVLLLYACNHPSRAVFKEELARLQTELDLRCVYVFENPDPAWQGERGFITADVLARHLPPDVRHWRFFVCGPVPMMLAVEASLARIGIAAERVHTERFDLV